MPTVRCQRCDYEWEYTGDQEEKCTCPACFTSVSLNKNVVEAAEQVDTAEVEREVAGGEVVLELDGEVREMSVEEALQTLADRVQTEG